MGYQDALNAQVEVMKFWASDAGRFYMNQSNPGDDNDWALRRVLAEVFTSESVWVDRKICSLLTHAEKSWPDKFTVLETDVPLKSAFVLFETPFELPLPLVDPVGVTRMLDYPLAAISWNSTEISHFADVKLTEAGRGLTFTCYGRDARGHLALILSYGWIYGADRDWRVRREAIEESIQRKIALVEERNEYVQRVLASFLRFISQKILTQEKPHLAKKVQRRVAKYIPNPSVSVVKLRREESQRAQESEDVSVQWSCSWPVSAHWHRYKLRTGEYRVRWVDEYVKGPDTPERPLRVPKKVYEVNR